MADESNESLVNDQGLQQQHSPETPAFVETEVEIPEVDGITPEQFTKMGNFLMQGMNENEAALLAGLDKLTIAVMKRNSANYNEFVERKKLEFKRKHLQILSTKKDPRISQWLLERLSPEDFSGKKKGNDVPENVVASIIRDIQQGNQNGSELAFAYKENVKDDGSQAQRASRDAAADRIRQVLQ